jgi:hypothetical protein
MKVKELVDILLRADQSLEVVIQNGDMADECVPLKRSGVAIVHLEPVAGQPGVQHTVEPGRRGSTQALCIG